MYLRYPEIHRSNRGVVWYFQWKGRRAGWCREDHWKWMSQGTDYFQESEFRYPSRPDEEVLTNINLTIPENQMVALVGSSGAGKSTIASLLLRLHEPTSGDIIFWWQEQSWFLSFCITKPDCPCSTGCLSFRRIHSWKYLLWQALCHWRRDTRCCGEGNAMEFIDRFRINLTPL